MSSSSGGNPPTLTNPNLLAAQQEMNEKDALIAQLQAQLVQTPPPVPTPVPVPPTPPTPVPVPTPTPVPTPVPPTPTPTPTPKAPNPLSIPGLIKNPNARVIAHWMGFIYAGAQPKDSTKNPGYDMRDPKVFPGLIADATRAGVHVHEMNCDAVGGQEDKVVKLWIPEFINQKAFFQPNVDGNIYENALTATAAAASFKSYLDARWGSYANSPYWEKTLDGKLCVTTFWKQLHGVNPDDMLAILQKEYPNVEFFTNTSWKGSQYYWHPNADPNGQTKWYQNMIKTGHLAELMLSAGFWDQVGKTGIGAWGANPFRSYPPGKGPNVATLQACAAVLNALVPTGYCRIRVVTWTDYPEGTAMQAGQKTPANVNNLLQFPY